MSRLISTIFISKDLPMSWKPYCVDQCTGCPLSQLDSQEPYRLEKARTVIGQVLEVFSISDVLTADARRETVYDTRTLDTIRWEASLLSKGRACVQLAQQDERCVDAAIVRIAQNECEHYSSERRH